MITAPAARSRATAVAVAHRLAALEQRRAAFGRVVGGIEDILDRDRNAVQRPDANSRCGGARRAPRAWLSAVVRIEMREGVHLVVDRGDALETGADIFFRRHLAAGDLLGGLDRGQRYQFGPSADGQRPYSLCGSQSAISGKM